MLLSFVLSLAGCNDQNAKLNSSDNQVKVSTEVVEDTVAKESSAEDKESSQESEEAASAQSASDQEDTATTNSSDKSDAKEDTATVNTSDEGDSKEKSAQSNQANLFAGYRKLAVDGGNLSGHREPNVVVDIGFGNREYWAFTNQHGQLVKVVAKEIRLQDDHNEPVTSKGRYYRDEAKVPGVESPKLDEGHVIADSLGGVSNAYNITPQNSTMNRHGDQAYMEKNIRAAGGCKDFVAIITYPDTKTQIPSHYSYTYTLKGNVINDEFDNINPDDTYGKKKTPAVTPAKPTEKPKKTPVVVPVKPAPKPTKPAAKPETPANSGGGSNYVLNTNSKKYHLPTCGSAKRMKGSNKKEVKDTKANLEKQGYQNCKRCLK